jgi:hypothetical protein
MLLNDSSAATFSVMCLDGYNSDNSLFTSSRWDNVSVLFDFFLEDAVALVALVALVGVALVALVGVALVALVGVALVALVGVALVAFVALVVVWVSISSLSVVASLSGDGGCGTLGPGPFKLLLYVRAASSCFLVDFVGFLVLDGMVERVMGIVLIALIALIAFDYYVALGCIYISFFVFNFFLNHFQFSNFPIFTKN